jgi:hypothetical protein
VSGYLSYGFRTVLLVVHKGTFSNLGLFSSLFHNLFIVESLLCVNSRIVFLSTYLSSFIFQSEDVQLRTCTIFLISGANFV